MIVEETVAGADDGLAIAGGIPSESEPRSDILVLARDAFLDAERLFGGGIDGGSRGKERGEIGVITQTVIDRQFSGDAPGILSKETDGNIVEGLDWKCRCPECKSVGTPRP